MTHREIADILINNKKADISEINKRMGFVIMERPIKGDIKILTGKEAEDFISKINIKEEVVDTSVTELKGTCACSGNAKGVIKIVNTPEEISKMEQGNIMVSHTTYPSLVPAMKKAAAIITEDGGITCHAAIVSRELGTPCITGIKTATKVLKDGYEVEVNAGEGVIKILEKAK